MAVWANGKLTTTNIISIYLFLMIILWPIGLEQLVWLPITLVLLALRVIFGGGSAFRINAYFLVLAITTIVFLAFVFLSVIQIEEYHRYLTYIREVSLYIS